MSFLALFGFKMTLLGIPFLAQIEPKMGRIWGHFEDWFGSKWGQIIKF